MSHEIGKNDKQQGITMAWHNLTEVLSVITLATCFLAAWDVFKRPLFRKVKDATVPGGIREEETDACEVVCTDDENIVIGKTVDCNSYTLLSNVRFLTICQDTLNLIRGAIVASVGSVCDRGRIFVSLALPRDLPKLGESAVHTLTAAGREFQFFLTFFSSHDKSAPFGVQMSSVCTVCNNTFNMNLNDRDGERLSIRIPHTKNMGAALDDVPAIVDAFFTSAQRFADVMNSLALVPIDEENARNFFAGFLAKKDKAIEADDASESEVAETNTRRMNRITRLVELFVSGKGNGGKNHADVFSALTDFYSHESSGDVSPLRQMASSEFGNGQTMKATAFAILCDDKKTASTIAHGKAYLANASE